MSSQKKKSLHRIFFMVLWAIGLIGAFVLASYLVETPSYDTLFNQCITKCKTYGKFGNLVKQPGPASPKPLAQKFECVCS